MSSVVVKKRTPSTYQVLATTAKQMRNYEDKKYNVPGYKETFQIRTKKIALEFLKKRADPNITPISIKDYAKRYHIGAQTLSNAVKALSNEPNVRNTPQQANIGNYQKRKTAMFKRVAVEGEESLSGEDLAFFQKIKQEEVKRRAAVEKKLKERTAFKKKYESDLYYDELPETDNTAVERPVRSDKQSARKATRAGGIEPISSVDYINAKHENFRKSLVEKD